MNMKQKIEVQVTAAVNEQWPKVFGNSNLAYMAGAKLVVVQDATNSYLMLAVSEELQCQFVGVDFSSEKPFVAACIGFADLDSAYFWWTNPQPVKQEPETIKVKDLKSGSFFQVGKDVFLHATCQHCPTLTNIGTTVVFDDNREVIPFYGTITINVGRDAE